LDTHDIQISASTEAALEQICRTLENQYGDQITIHRPRGPRGPQGEWVAWGTFTLPATRHASRGPRQSGHQRIILADNGTYSTPAH
jgi:hypothetical protein